METSISTLSISYDPNYLIISTEKENEFIFYNSNIHYGRKCNALELHLLDLVYKYKSANYIADKVNEKYKEQVRTACLKIIDSKILSTEKFSEDKTDTICMPSIYYIHLTYKCNLSCTYCYNKDIRKNKKELPLEQWKKIIDKIVPYASSITLTGGEVFLYQNLLNLVQYIKEKKRTISINCISNCMHDFSEERFQTILAYIDTITFSCDSVYAEKDRKGFNPDLFRNNIKYLKTHHPKTGISISTTLSNATVNDVKATTQFAKENQCYLRTVPLLPTDISQIENMVPIETFKQILCEKDENSIPQKLKTKQVRCGAAQSTCSIDPLGNVYPCHLLHYRTFLMGNLLDKEISQLRFINPKGELITDFIPNIDNVSGCQTCKVRHICGGGCLALTYILQGSMFNRNQLMCPYNYEIAIAKLKNIP